MYLREISEAANEAIAFVVGNPPYQQIIAREDTLAEQKTVTNIFHLFHQVAREISSTCSFIYPGQRWMNRSGKALAQFGQQMVNSPTLKTVIYWQDSKDIFPHVAISDGVTVVWEKAAKMVPGWVLDFRWHSQALFDVSRVDTPGENPIIVDPRQRAIIEQVWAGRDRGDNLQKRCTPQKTFGLESNFVEENPHRVRALENIPADPENWVRALLNDAAGKGGRARWYWLPRSEIRSRTELVDQWKITVSSMNCVGARGTGHSPLAEILPPGTVFGRSRLALATFSTEGEARNFFKLMQTDFYRFLYGSLGDSQGLLGRLAPDLGVYDGKCFLDFSKSVESLHGDLVRHFGLTEEQGHFMTVWTGDRLSPFLKHES